MKTTRNGKLSLAATLVTLFAICLMLRAQTSMQATDSGNMLQPVAIGDIPEGAAFFKFTDYLANGGSLGAPYPFLMNTNVAVYSVNVGVFLVDDAALTNDDDLATALLLLAQPQDEFSARIMSANSMDPGDTNNFGSGTNIFQWSPPPAIETNGLWIEVPTNSLAAIDQFAIVVHNTLPDEPYDVLTTTNLALPLANWTVEDSVLGSEETNVTPSVLTLNGRMNLFVFARYGGSSDGSGLPDWWQLRYFGATGTDPFAQDPSGDGWTYFDDYQKGFIPGSTNTPAAPRLTVTYNPANANVIVSWPPSPGNVVGYTIEKYDALSNTTIDTNFLSGTTSFTDTAPSQPSNPFYWGPTKFVSYRAKAHLSIGDSGWGEKVFLEPAAGSPAGHHTATLPIYLIAGQGHATFLAASSLPVNAAIVQLTRTDPYAEGYFNDNSLDITYDIPVSSFTNGVYRLPTTWTDLTQDPYGGIDYFWYAKVIYTTNGATAASPLLTYNQTFINDSLTRNWTTAPFWDGRQQLQQNLFFLLRAGPGGSPFGYMERNDPYVPIHHLPPVTYAYAGFYVPHGFNSCADIAFRDVFQPFKENYQYRNFTYSETNLGSDGGLNTGVDPETVTNYYSCDDILRYSVPFLNPPFAFQFPDPTNTMPISAILDPTSDARWIYFRPFYASSDMSMINVTSAGGKYWMTNNVRSWFGLEYESAKFAYDPGTGVQTADLNIGRNISAIGGYVYTEADQPGLQTQGYYFAQIEVDPIPGNTAFSSTNTTRSRLFAGFGQTSTFAAYAKQLLTNSPYPGVYGYLGQYFEHAYIPGTTNEAGILSSYGDFFPTNVGPATLVTMTNLGENVPGTGVVNVIKLQLDVNHDGIMDLSFGGPDNTSAAYPFKFWINNDRDDAGNSTNLDHDVYLPPNETTNKDDYSFYQIRTMRNLEDFTRLWVCGIPTLPLSEGYSVQIGWSQIDAGAPKLQLYRAAETTGGIGYLTNITTASQQITNYDYYHPIGEITPTESVNLPASWFTNNLNKYFLFEAGAPGKGALTLSIMLGTNVIAQTTAWMDFHDIKDFYEEVAIRDVIQTWPEMVQTNLTSSYTVVSSPTGNIGEANQTAVFVHGWRMPYSDYTIFSQTMFKRLYWEGYQGKFATVRWPTRSSDTDSGGLDFTTYNRSEYISFKSATGAALYLYDLRNRFKNDVISVCSHSQGGILMMEALKELAASSVSPVDNYVLMETAVPAHCYDTTITNLPALIDAETNILTPNTYSNYAAGMRSALRGGTICNLFNPADFALVSGLDGKGFGSWESNEELMKPLIFFGYFYIETNQTAYVITNQYTEAFGITNLQSRIVTDPLELMPFVARPHSKAVGAQVGVGDVVNGPEYNLQSQLGFTAATYDHSGQFNRNIQTTQVQGFYSRLLQNLFPPAP